MDQRVHAPGFMPEKVYLGSGPFGLDGFQVAEANALIAPPRYALRDLFAPRKCKPEIHLAVAVIHDGHRPFVRTRCAGAAIRAHHWCHSKRRREQHTRD